MGATISKLSVKLTADTGKFVQGMNKGSKGVNKLGKSAGGISPAMMGIGAAVAVATAALAALAVGIAKVNAAFERMDKAAKAAKSIDIAAQTLQGFQHAASLAGVEGAQMTKAFQKMQKGIGEAAQGIGTAKIAFEELGMSTLEMQQLSPDEQFLKISEALSKIEDPAKRAALATQVFGRAGADLLPLINQGSDAIAKQVAELERLQGPMSDIDFTNIEDANDAATRFGLTVEGVWNQLAAAIAPAKEIVFDTLTEAGSELANFISENKEGITAFFVGIADGVKIAVEGIMRLVKTFAGIAASFAPASKKMGDFTEKLLGVRLGITDILIPGKGLYKLISKLAGWGEADKLSEQIDKWNQKIADQQKAVDDLDKGLRRIQGAAIDESAMEAPAAVLSYDELLAKADELKEKNKSAIDEATRLTETLREQIALGDQAIMSKEDQEKLQEKINKLEIDANATNAEHLETSKKINKEKEKMQKRADKLTEGLKTQADKYREQLAEIQELQSAGALTEGQAIQLSSQIHAKIQSDADKIIDAQAKAEKGRLDAWEKSAEKAGKSATTKLIRAGSKEMFEKVAKAQFKKDNPLAKFQKETVKVQKDQLTTLRDIAGKIGTGGGGAGGGAGGGGGASPIEVGLGA